jgi:hypothetical protein
MMIDFSDEELSMIQTLCIKCDPAQVISPAQSVIKKISDYAAAKQQAQMQEAAEVTDAVDQPES